MRKLLASIAVPVFVLGVSFPTFAQTQTDGTKKPHPPTNEMDKASSPEKTGVPDSGSSAKGKGQDALPATKTMDKAASPKKDPAKRE